MAQLICENLSLGYDGKEIVSNINFKVNCGDYLSIVGDNGSGKSTLMKTLLGLLSPLSGTITKGDGLEATQIGYLPQQTVVQRDFPASVKEIVLSGCQNRGGFRPFYNKLDKATAYQNMKKMGIDSLANHCYRELSGGQQQRVLLARALCATKSMLLLDEPVAGLDPRVTEEMYQLIADLNCNDNITIIMITHDITSALRYSSHILNIGDNIFFGTKDEYIAFEAEKGGADVG